MWLLIHKKPRAGECRYLTTTPRERLYTVVAVVVPVMLRIVARGKEVVKEPDTGKCADFTVRCSSWTTTP